MSSATGGELPVGFGESVPPLIFEPALSLEECSFIYDRGNLIHYQSIGKELLINLKNMFKSNQ